MTTQKVTIETRTVTSEAEQKPTDRQLGERLAERYYLAKQTGGQTHYWDSKTGNSNLTSMHLHSSLYADKDFGEHNIIKRAQDIVRMTLFKPIILQSVYKPKAARVVKLHDHWHPNDWREPEVKPDPLGDPQPFIQHLTRMLGCEKKTDYLIDMLAYRYQSKDNTKPHVAFYFYGGQGFGKGIFSTTLEKVFGESAVRKVIDQNSLKSISSIDVWKRTWTIVDEVDVKAGSTDYNRLKTMIGGNTFDAERKGEHFKQHEIPAQLIMNSNHAPHFIEADDRRFFISKWETTFKPDQESKADYFTRYVHWLEKEQGYQAIAQLLTTRDISKVQISAHAMMTEEKELVTTMMADPIVGEIKLLIEEHPDVICFTADMFETVWDGTPKNQQKYKLEEAGLTLTEKKHYEAKRRAFWIRNGWKLIIKNGVLHTLMNKEAGETRYLKDDLGYKHSVHHKLIEGWKQPDF